MARNRISRASALRTCLIALALANGASCSEPTGPRQPSATRVDDEWVTGEAAAGVNSTTGLFTLAPPPSAVLNAASAEAAALAYLRLSLNPGTVSNARASFEEQHGGPIADWDQLHPCGRTVYGTSPFGRVPAPAPIEAQRALSPAWSVTLCGPDGLPDVTAGVTDAVSGARIVGSDYMIADLDSLRTMHTQQGVPRGWRTGIALSPEDAVRAFFEATSVRISRVPIGHLMWTSVVTVPACMSWQIELEESVVGRYDSGEFSHAVTRLFVRRVPPGCMGNEIAFYAADEDQPSAYWFRYPVQVEPFTLDSVSVPTVGPLTLRRVRFQ